MSIQGNTAIESGNNPSAAASALVSDAGGAAHECPSPVLTADRHPWDAFHRVEMLLIAILAAFLSMLVAGEMFAASKSPAPGNLPVLNQVAQIRRLPPEQSGRGYPVKLRGVITYSVPEWGVTFFQDATAGIFIWGSSSLAKVRPGNLVEIRGKTAPGDFAPVVDQPEVRFWVKHVCPALTALPWKTSLPGKKTVNGWRCGGLCILSGLRSGSNPICVKQRPRWY